jgi:hypothetical protein
LFAFHELIRKEHLMTQMIRLPALAGAITAALCLATLAPTNSNEAVAQGIRVSVPVQARYGMGYNRYSGYGSGRYGVGSYQSAGYRGYGYSDYGYGGYGGQAYGYSGYGNGPYGYGSPAVYTYPSVSYGYRIAPTYNLQYRGLQFQGGAYRPVYNPNQTRFYSPYGYERY